MLHTLKLLLPAVIPSWRFFDIIAPSPRIQFTLLSAENEQCLDERTWQEFRPRPAHLTVRQMLGHMLWNPWRNESLFLVSCAERLLQQPTKHSEDEILKRIVADLRADVSNPCEIATHLQFRLLLVQREGSELQQGIVFHSRIQSLAGQNLT
jgi:glutamine synthetase